MAKPMSKLGIMNAMGDAAHKKARMPKEGSPAEEAQESPEQEAAEQNPKAKQAKAIAAKKKSPLPLRKV